MCTQCKQNRLLPEFEAILHGEWEEELMPEWEGNRASATVKAAGPRSPFFNWLSDLQQETSYLPGYTQKSSEAALIRSAIAGGERNENTLTDLVFHKRHPELGGRPLSASQPNFSTLSQEWIQIRNTLVRPALQAPSAPPAQKQPPAAKGALLRKATLQRVLNALRRKGYIIYQRPYELNIVGVRAWTAQPNSFDDVIALFYKDASGNWQFRACPATTDPGSSFLVKPINNQTRTAILKPGQYVGAYIIGTHSGTSSQYTALVQRGGPVTIFLDSNLDNRLDFDSPTSTGYFGINIHRAKSSGTATTVDTFSAGCQVFANTEDFNEMMRLSEEHNKRYGNKFTYTLITERDL